jgi:hypothetical protein
VAWYAVNEADGQRRLRRDERHHSLLFVFGERGLELKGQVKRIDAGPVGAAAVGRGEKREDAHGR